MFLDYVIMRKEYPFSLTETAGEKRLRDVARQRVVNADRRKRNEILLMAALGIFMVAMVLWLMSRGIGGEWLGYAVGGTWMAFTIARTNYVHREGRKISRLEWVLSLLMIGAMLAGMTYLYGTFEYLEQIFNLT
jgi:hypothetical protein